jgi:hypothetical protein
MRYRTYKRGITREARSCHATGQGVLLPSSSRHWPPCSLAYFRCFRFELAKLLYMLSAVRSDLRVRIRILKPTSHKKQSILTHEIVTLTITGSRET